MHEKPAEAVRAKPDSSLVAAHVAVAEGRAGAVVSAGNTGAMLAAGLLHLRREVLVGMVDVIAAEPAEQVADVVLADAGQPEDVEGARRPGEIDHEQVASMVRGLYPPRYS